MSNIRPDSSGSADSVGADGDGTRPSEAEASDTVPEATPTDGAESAAPERETERLLDDIKQVRE